MAHTVKKSKIFGVLPVYEKIIIIIKRIFAKHFKGKSLNLAHRRKKSSLFIFIVCFSIVIKRISVLFLSEAIMT